MMNSFSRSALRCCYNNPKVFVTSVRCSSSNTAESIIIPRRIKRGPTDILKALASTVQKDFTAPHYKYHDDPFLIPASNIGRRTFAMSKESGRKAARWIQSEHSEFFNHRVANPFIKEFSPPAAYNENSVVDENTLKDVIKKAEVSNAITVYELLEKQGTSKISEVLNNNLAGETCVEMSGISHNTLQSLLELLCYFNCENPISEELLEERWFTQGSVGKERQRKTWKDNSLAEKIFLSFENKDAAAYSALIQGMTRYFQVDRAMQLYEECKNKKLLLGTETYNSLIRVGNFLRESTELRWKLIQDFLSDMQKERIQPNIGTLNAALETISTIPNQKLSKGFALRVIAEFKKLNIEPSLASYYYLLITFCKDRGPTSNILNDIMNHIDGKEFSIQDPKDTYFFVTAMDVCRNHLQDRELGYRVNNLLNTGNNYIFIGDAYKESIYYRHYLLLMCGTETFDQFMNLYHKYVPHTYVPEPRVMEEIIKTIDMNGAVEHLPQIWSNMVVFDHVEQEKPISALLECMVRHQPEDGNERNTSFGNIAWDAWSRIEDVEENRYRKWRWTGSMLGDVLILQLRAGNFDNARIIMTKLIEAQQEIVGIPPVSALQTYLNSCIANNNIKTAIACIQYCADVAYPEIQKMAKQVIKELSPSSDIITKLANIVGKDLQEGNKGEI